MGSAAPWLTLRMDDCSVVNPGPRPRLVTRDHIDFGRVWSAACC